MNPLNSHVRLFNPRNSRRVLHHFRTCLRPALLLLQLMMLSVLISFAQDLDDVNISGRVADENGASVVGAKVVVKHTATGVERTTTVDAEGLYRFVELAPGAYTARASAAGFAAEMRAVGELAAGRNVRLDFVLRPAGVTAEQTVASEAGGAAVDTARTIVGGTLTRSETETLPLSTRAPLDLIYTLGGVTEEPLSTRDLAEDRARTPARTPEEAGTFALSGGAAYSNNLTIDGLDNNDDRAARERFQPSLEAVEEVQVVTNQFSAEYGRASGGRVNLRTRSGTGRFHGRAFYFFRDESLNANTPANNARGLKRLPLQEHNSGFTLGGALRAPARLFHARPAKRGDSDDEQAERGDGDDGQAARRARHFFFLAAEFQTVLDSTVIDTMSSGINPELMEHKT